MNSLRDEREEKRGQGHKNRESALREFQPQLRSAGTYPIGPGWSGVIQIACYETALRRENLLQPGFYCAQLFVGDNRIF